MRTPRQTRFYPPQTSEEESKAIRTLRRQTSRDLLLALMENGTLGFKDLVKASGKSPSTVSTYLSQTVFDNLVEIKFMGLKKKYHIKMEDVLDRLAEDYRPGMLEKPSSGFEE